jgi:hypothetical protein
VPATTSDHTFGIAPNRSEHHICGMKSKVTYNIDDDSIRAIRRLAVAEERSRSSIVNRILREALADADLKPTPPTSDVS